MARGGRRAGKPGALHPQRSDLQLPVTAPTGLPYGDAGKLRAAQRAVPMATAPTPGPAPGAPPQGLPQAPPPGHLLRPTERPNEPVTAGLASGPGPGPEALSPLTQSTGNGGSTVAGLLSGLASSPYATDEVRQLASYSQGGAK